MIATTSLIEPNFAGAAEALAFLRVALQPSRLAHSIEVMEVMAELAQVYCLDPAQAKLCGLLHDCAKDFSESELLQRAQASGFVFSQACERLPLYLHGPVSALVAKEDLGIRDPILLSAIATHTLLENGSDFHAPLSWCLRFADVLAPSRSWKEVKARLSPAIYAGQMRRAAALYVDWLISFYPSQSIPIHPHIYGLQRELAADC